MSSGTEVLRREAPPLADYAGARSSFSWDAVAADLGGDQAALNLGDLATAKQVALGRGSEHAFIWHGAQGGAPYHVTYAELAAATARAANVFAGHGIERGDRVLFLLPVIPELLVGVLGALRAGAVVGVLGAGRNMEYLRNIVTRSRPRAFVTASSFRNTIGALRTSVPELKTAYLVNRSKLSMPALDAGEYAWSDQLESASEDFTAAATTAADRAWLHYTELGMSGSVVSHMAALPLFNTARSVLEMRAGESVLSVFVPGDEAYLPYGILAPLLAGSTQLILEDPVHCQNWADLAATHQPRAWFSGFKAIDVILRVDSHLGTLLRNCRNVACLWPYDKGFITMTEGSYGSPIHAVWTEREFGAIQTAEMRGTKIRPGSVGRAVPGTEVAVVDGAGKPLGAGVTGKLAVKLGPAAPFVEYWGDPQLTGDRSKDGWFVTNHNAKIDSDGYVWILA